MTLVTMRPSDVPTYVEAGAADVGITGKDVLLEQADRVVYELLDLGFGRCRMVLAGRDGDERLGESQRRLGMMRIATKYPRIAERYFERTGRQVEVIEVKGSVELAPLIGLGDGIVDLVATGRTLEENDLEVREEILECTARFVANRVAHKLRAAEVDELTAKLREASGAMRAQRFEWDGSGRDRRRAPRLGAPSRRPTVDVGPIERRGASSDGDAARAAADRRASTRPSGRSSSLRVDAGEAEAALAALDPALREALELAARQRPRRRRGAARPSDRDGRAAAGPDGDRARGRRSAPAGIYAPGGRAAYPSSVLMCAIPAQVAGVERIALASPPGPGRRASHPLVLAAAALCGVEEIYAIGGAQAIFALAYGTETIAPVDVIAGPGNAWVREAKRAVYGTVGIDSLRRPLGADADRRPRHRPRVGRARPLRPGRARRRQPAGRRRGRGARARRDRRARPRPPPQRGRASPTRRWRWSRSPTSRRRDRPRQRLRPRAPASCWRRTRRCWPSG